MAPGLISKKLLRRNALETVLAVVGQKKEASGHAVMKRDVIICTTVGLSKEKKIDLEMVSAESWLCFEV